MKHTTGLSLWCHYPGWRWHGCPVCHRKLRPDQICPTHRQRGLWRLQAHLTWEEARERYALAYRARLRSERLAKQKRKQYRRDRSRKASIRPNFRR